MSADDDEDRHPRSRRPENPRRPHARGVRLRRPCPDGDEHPFAFLAYAWDSEKKGFPWELNPDFIDLVKEWAEPDERILVSCRSGGRSAMAINQLAAAGFANVYNILDGMEGSKVDDRERVPRHAAEERLEGLGLVVDVRPRSRADGLPERESQTLHPGNVHD